MSSRCFNSGPTPQQKTGEKKPVKQYCAICRPVFLIVVGDPGLGDHNSGQLFDISAYHHYNEIQQNKFPGIPKFDKTKHDIVAPIRISTGSDLNSVLGKHKNILYLAYFGHSWGSTGRSENGVLMIGEDSAPDTNLGNSGGTNDTPFSALTNAYHLNPRAQIRLFGCQGGYTGPRTGVWEKSIPPASQIADIVTSGITVYGYKSNGGSLFTDNIKLGHGDSRKLTQAEVTKSFPRVKKGDAIWLIAAGSNRGWGIFSGKLASWN